LIRTTAIAIERPAINPNKIPVNDKLFLNPPEASY